MPDLRALKNRDNKLAQQMRYVSFYLNSYYASSPWRETLSLLPEYPRAELSFSFTFMGH